MNSNSIASNIPKFGMILDGIMKSLEESPEVQMYNDAKDAANSTFLFYQNDAAHVIATAEQSLTVAREELETARKLLEADPTNEDIKRIVAQKEEVIKNLSEQKNKDEDFLDSLNNINEQFLFEVEAQDKQVQEFNERFNAYNKKFDRSRDSLDVDYETY